jgi:hypothetical protein
MSRASTPWLATLGAMAADPDDSEDRIDDDLRPAVTH